MDILPACRSVQYRCAVPLEAKEGTGCPGTGVTVVVSYHVVLGIKANLQEAEFFSPLCGLFSQRERQAEGGRQRRTENMKLEEVCDLRVQKDLLKRRRWREKHDQHISLVCVRADI